MPVGATSVWSDRQKQPQLPLQGCKHAVWRQSGKRLARNGTAACSVKEMWVASDVVTPARRASRHMQVAQPVTKAEARRNNPLLGGEAWQYPVPR